MELNIHRMQRAAGATFLQCAYLSPKNPIGHRRHSDNRGYLDPPYSNLLNIPKDFPTDNPRSHLEV